MRNVEVDILEVVSGVVAIVTAVVSAGGGVIYKAASGAVESATTAAVQAAQVANNAPPAANAINVTCCGGLITGNALEVTQIANRFLTAAKIGTAMALVEGITASGVAIAKAVAEEKSKVKFSLTPYLDAAIEEAVNFPQTPTYVISSASINSSLQLGLTKK